MYVATELRLHRIGTTPQALQQLLEIRFVEQIPLILVPDFLPVKAVMVEPLYQATDTLLSVSEHDVRIANAMSRFPRRNPLPVDDSHD